LERRIQRVQEANQLSASAARDLVNREDVGRRRYLRKYFDQDIDNPLLYHLVLNTDLISSDEAARIIGEAVKPVHTLAKTV
jgi:cytidylate kinase